MSSTKQPVKTSDLFFFALPTSLSLPLAVDPVPAAFLMAFFILLGKKKKKNRPRSVRAIAFILSIYFFYFFYIWRHVMR